MGDSSDEEMITAEVTKESLKQEPPDTSDWDVDITFKYLDGKITFDELANVMEQTGTPEEEERPEEAFEREFVASQFKGKKSKSKAEKSGQQKRRRNKLPKDLMGLVGEANVCFARGDHEDAIKMYMEVIRLAPTAPEPFQQLGMFYEESGDIQKAFQLLLIASYLLPSDGDGWIKVAELAVELGNLKQAVICYNRAIRIHPENINLHFQRCQLHEKLGDMKKAIDGYDSLMRNLQPSDGELALKLAKDIVKLHYNNKEINSGIQVMEAALSKYHSFVTSEEVNVYLELLIYDKKFEKSLSAFQKYCGVKFLIDEEECEELTNEILCSGNLQVHLVYLELPIDLRAKLIVALINLRSLKSIEELLTEIYVESPEEIGDLYLDIIDAFIFIKEYSRANALLVKLLDTAKYNDADIWVRYADCLRETQDINASIIAYSTVIRLSPNNFYARFELSKLLMTLGKEKEALQVSGNFKTEEEVDVELLFFHCKLLYTNKLWYEFSRAAQILLLSDMHYLKHPREISIMISSSSFRTRLESLRDVHREFNINEDFRYKYTNISISSEQRFDIFVKLCYALLYKTRDYNELTRIVFSAYTCPSFSDKEEVLDFYVLMSCYSSGETTYTYSLIKSLLSRQIFNNQLWNLFCPIMMRLYQDLRHNRFCIRLFIKNPDHLALAYFNGHNALMSGSYKHALAEYVGILKQNPEDPFAAFSVALAFVHLACQKFTSNRHSIVIQLCAFLDLYLELRGECQESLYNVGRAFHQLGLVHNAVHFYKRVLQWPESAIVNDENRLYDLRREAVYNLVLIYKNSGANDLALQLLKKHFVI